MPSDERDNKDNAQSMTVEKSPERRAETCELMEVDEVAAKLKVCKATVYKMVRNGEIEAVHIGRLVRITPEGYRQLLDRRSRGAR